jgi:hypothetical protein
MRRHRLLPISPWENRTDALASKRDRVMAWNGSFVKSLTERWARTHVPVREGWRGPGGFAQPWLRSVFFGEGAQRALVKNHQMPLVEGEDA